MKISCDVISDLLPLYAEKLTCEASNRIILEHLSKCENCQNELLQITKTMELPANLNDYNNLKKAKNRDRRFKIIGIVSVVLVIALVFLIIKPYLYLPYLYPGDRITLCVDGSIDSEDVDLDSKAVTCEFDHDLQEVHFSNSEPGKFSTKGSEYGGYTFTIPAKDYTIKIQLHHTNWWQIDNCKLHFDIDSQNNNINYIFIDTSGNIESGTSDLIGKTYTVSFMI